METVEISWVNLQLIWEVFNWRNHPNVDWMSSLNTERILTKYEKFLLWVAYRNKDTTLREFYLASVCNSCWSDRNQLWTYHKSIKSLCIKYHSKDLWPKQLAQRYKPRYRMHVFCSKSSPQRRYMKSLLSTTIFICPLYGWLDWVCCSFIRLKYC